MTDVTTGVGCELYIIATDNAETWACPPSLDTTELQTIANMPNRRERLASFFLQRYALCIARPGLRAASITISNGPYGKPYCPQVADWHYSASHSQQIAVLAMTGIPVGVDIEPVGPNAARVLGGTFGPSFASLDAHTATLLWTNIEAYLKWKGIGLVGLTDSLHVARDGVYAITEGEIGNAPLVFTDISDRLPDGMVGSLFADRAVSIRTHHPTWDVLYPVLNYNSQLALVSDIHAEHKANRDEFCNARYALNTILLVAGDLNTAVANVAPFEELFAAMPPHRSVFAAGNHDLYSRGSIKTRFDELKRLAAQHHVSMVPCQIDGVWFVPLHTWFRADFITPKPPSASELEYDAFLVGETERAIANLSVGGAPVVTISHFLPRRELLPHYHQSSRLATMCGHPQLEVWIRKLGSKLHICGHTHIAIDCTIDGVRYVQHPWGYEWETQLPKTWMYLK